MGNGRRYSRLREDREILERTLRLIKFYQELHGLRGIDHLVRILESEIRRIEAKLRKMERSGIIL